MIGPDDAYGRIKEKTEFRETETLPYPCLLQASASTLLLSPILLRDFVLPVLLKNRTAEPTFQIGSHPSSLSVTSVHRHGATAHSPPSPRLRRIHQLSSARISRLLLRPPASLVCSIASLP
ncbi:hypothetical protein AHAS_Ahas12G0042700 [Arachis hypogaea]